MEKVITYSPNVSLDVVPSLQEAAAALQIVDASLAHPVSDMPRYLFDFVVRITPMVNVDVLVFDSKGGFFLTWRDDPQHGSGWHIPGGIVRNKERFMDRANRVIETELALKVQTLSSPVQITERINPDSLGRSHFLSILILGHVASSANYPSLEKNSVGDGVKLFKRCPKDLLSVHYDYRPFMSKVVFANYFGGNSAC